MNFKSILPAIGLASLMLIAPARAASTTDQAVADIVKAQTKLHSLKSLTADIATVNTMGGKTSKATGTVKCLKPNYLWIETRGTAGHQWHISDGKQYCTNDPKGHWTSVKADSHGANFRDDLLLWSDFYVLFATGNAQRVVGGADVSIADKTVDGRPYLIITAIHKMPHPMTMTVYIAKWDGLIHRMIVDGGPMHMQVTWSNIRQNAPLKASGFEPKY